MPFFPSSKATRLLPLISLLPALGTGANISSAAVTYSGSQNISIPFSFGGVYLDIETATTSASEFSGWDLNFFFGGEGIVANDSLNPVKTGTANTDPIRKLGLNSIVDSFTLSYGTGFSGSSTHIGIGADQFTAGAPGYLGFHFTPDGGGTRYGWMQVTLNQNGDPGTIHDWAWENSGSSILTGAIPEPTSALLLSTSILATLLLRHRSSERG